MSSPDELRRAYKKGFTHAARRTMDVLRAAFRDQWDAPKIERRINRMFTRRAIDHEADAFIEHQGAKDVHR